MKTVNKQVVKPQTRKIVIVKKNKSYNKPVNDNGFVNKPNFVKKPLIDNKIKQPVKSTIKKISGLKPMPIQNYKNKRMYRLSIIFGSTVITDTFIVDIPFPASIVLFRDKLLASYQDLLKILDKQVGSSMLPKPYTRILETTDKGIITGENKDIIHKITKELYTPTINPSELCFNSIVNCNITPGSPVKGVTKRIVIRVNHVNNPNFSPKKVNKSTSKKPINKDKQIKKTNIKKK